MIEHPFGIYLKVVLLGLGRLFPNFLRNRHTNIQSGCPIHLEVSILYVLNISILERVVWLDFFSPMTVVMFHGFIYAGISGDTKLCCWTLHHVGCYLLIS